MIGWLIFALVSCCYAAGWLAQLDRMRRADPENYFQMMRRHKLLGCPRWALFLGVLVVWPIALVADIANLIDRVRRG